MTPAVPRGDFLLFFAPRRVRLVDGTVIVKRVVRKWTTEFGRVYLGLCEVERVDK